MNIKTIQSYGSRTENEFEVYNDDIMLGYIVEDCRNNEFCAYSKIESDSDEFDSIYTTEDFEEAVSFIIGE